MNELNCPICKSKTIVIQPERIINTKRRGKVLKTKFICTKCAALLTRVMPGEEPPTFVGFITIQASLFPDEES